MGQENNRVRIRRNGHPYGLFFVKPRKGCSADIFAKKVMERNGVEEVLLITGEYAFMVKARTEPEKGHGEVGKYLEHRFGRCTMIESHVQYKRRVR